MFKIKKKYIFIVLIFFTILAFFYLYFQESENNSLIAIEKNNKVIYFFYSEDCDTCIETLDKLNILINKKYKNVEVELFEISRNDENLNLLFSLLENYHYSGEYYDLPIVFIGENIMVGAKDVNRIESTLMDFIDIDFKYDQTKDLISNFLKNEENYYFLENYITIPIILVSGLVDSVNPCAIAVIIFLIATISTIRDRPNILKYGLIYIITIFLIYFLLGTGIIYLFKEIKIPDSFFIIIGSILILFSIWSFKDYFWYGKGINLGIPSFLHSNIKKYIQKVSIISMIFLGILVAIFEATCSGAIYIGILTMISRQGISIKNLVILLLYNFVFILPLLIILIVFKFSLQTKKFQKFLAKNLARKSKNLYRLISGIILLFLGLYLIIWF